MRPILFEIFGFPVRAYGVFIALGILGGIWIAKRIATRRRPEHVNLIEDFAGTAIVAALLGARIWEVTFTWEYYSKHLWEIPAIWHGGISIQGAVFGGLLAAIWFARSRRLAVWDFLDTLTPGVLLGQAVGRLGSCLLNGDAFGKPTGTNFGLIYAPGSMAYETFGPVRLWPAEVFEGVGDLAILGLIVVVLRGRHRPGTAVLWYVLLYSILRFSLEFLRADSLMFFGVKAAQLTSLLFAGIAAVLLVRSRFQGLNIGTR